MAKRYYESRNRSMGNDEHDSRRTEEMQDGGMIRENRAAIANLPQEVMIKPWPMGGSYLPEPLNDTIVGVDRQLNEDAPVRKAGYRPEKLN